MIEHQLDIGVARGPRIKEQVPTDCFELAGRIIAQEIECGSERRAPFLVPAGLAAGVATTIAYPTTDSMRAAPRSAFPVWSLLDLNFELGRILVQKLAVVCQPEALLLRLHFKRMRQTQIAKLEMMAVSLAVGRNVNHRPAIACSLKHLHQRPAGRESFLERDRARNWTIVKENGN